MTTLAGMGEGTAKGTRFANWCVKLFRPIWPTVDRNALHGTLDDCDLINCGPFMHPIMVECKWRKTTKAWRIANWVATARRKERLHGRPWVILVAEDMRVSDPIMVCDARFGKELLMAYTRSMER